MNLRALPGRLAALALLGVLLWGVARGLAALLPAGAGDQAEDAALVARLSAMAQRRPGLEQQAQALEAALAAPRLLWSGSPAFATAAMQARVREAMATSGGLLRSTTEAPPEAEKGLLRIGLRVEANATMAALVDVLQRLGASAPMILVEGLTVTVQPVGEPAGPPVFTIRADLAGYLRAP
jgi:hypothetical protein